MEAVKAFVLIAELQSFTRAAGVLDTSQASISMKLRRLETQLGRRLLERTPRRVRLSAEGAVFLEAARELVDAHERAVKSFDTETRRLSIGVSQHLVGSRLPALMQQLSRHDATLKIDLRAAGSRELLQSLDNGTLDAAIALHDGHSRDNGKSIYTESFVWMAAPHWRPFEGEPLPLSTQGKSCSVRQAATRALDAAGVEWAEVFIGQGAASVGAAATAGIAVAVLAKRASPLDTIDVGAKFGLPALPKRKVILYSSLRDRRSRQALDMLADAFRTPMP
ncbi:MAG: LysR family transcriptional regulator [Rhodanobacteraceae bacterium]